MINIGMVLALLPVIGIPLPLVSVRRLGAAAVPGRARACCVGFARREPGAPRRSPRAPSVVGRSLAVLPGRRRGRGRRLSADARPPRRRRHGRPHLARCSPLADALRRRDPDVEITVPRHRARAGDPAGPGGAATR